MPEAMYGIAKLHLAPLKRCQTTFLVSGPVENTVTKVIVAQITASAYLCTESGEMIVG